MPQRITEDHKDFIDVYSGRIRKEMGKWINNGTLFRNRGRNGKVPMTVPRIDTPYIVHGKKNDGVGRGGGKPGDVIDKDKKGKGKGNQAGEEHQDGVTIWIDQEYILQFLQDELKLPDMQPKPNQTYEEIEIKYNNVSKVGPESLLHHRRTFKQALKRMLASDAYDEKHIIPGYKEPMKIITPINEDKRYRQWKEIKKPSHNAVIFFVRDGSASMDQLKCDIVSDMCWWIDVWIRRFYEKTERCYVWHDTIAQEIDEENFYKYRYGGGTKCSSSLELVAKQLENRYPPDKWNIYVFYFGDGENLHDDNKRFCDIIKEKFSPSIVNLFALAQVLSYTYDGSVKDFVDKHVSQSNVRTTAIGEEVKGSLSDGERDKQVKKAIIEILGADHKGKKVS